MASIPIDVSQADALLASQQITPEQYDRIVAPPVAPAPMAQPAVDPTLTAQPLPTPSPADTFGVDEDRRQRQRDMEAQRQAAIAGREEDQKRAALDAMRADLEQKRTLAQKMGFSSDEVNAKLKPLEDRLIAGEKKLAGFTPEQPKETTDAPLAIETSFTGDPSRDVGQQQPWDQNSAAFNIATPGLDMQQLGVLQAAQAGKEQAAAESSYLQEVRQQQENLAKEAELRRIAEQKQLETAANDINTATAEVSNLKVDPGRVWSNMETPNKILATIGLILGSFGQGGNKAVDVLQRVIDRDVQAQEADIANKRAGVSNKQTAYQMMRQRFGDNDVARNAAKAALWERAELQLQEIASRYKGQKAGAEAMVALGEIQNKKDMLKAEVAKQWATQQALAEGNTAAMTQEQRDRFVPGYGLAMTKEDATKLKDKVSAVNNSKAGIRDLLAMTETTGKSLSPSDRARAQTIANMLIGSLRTEIVGPGAMNESEIAIMKNIIRDPTSISSLDSSNKAALQTLMKRLDSSLEADLGARGMQSFESKAGIKPRAM